MWTIWHANWCYVTAGEQPAEPILHWELVAEAGISLMSRKVQFYIFVCEHQKLWLQNIRKLETIQSIVNDRTYAYSFLKKASK